MKGATSFMLTGVHVAFIGGDARQLEVIKKCTEKDATVSLIGFNQLQSEYTGATKYALSTDVLRDVDALILPIIGIQEDGSVESIFSDEPIYLLDEHLQSVSKHGVIYTGMANQSLQDLAKKAGLKIVQLLERDDIAIYNSIPTVEGALMMAIQHTDITIHGSKVVVLGLGRVGLSLARTVHHLGAEVRVGARNPADLARAYEMGLIPFHLDELANQIKECDLLFNTIPAQVVTAKVIANLPYHALIIDLASKHGGIDFRYAEKRGIKAHLAPSLPGLVAPKTAGRILAKVITQLIEEEKNNREESS